MITKNRVALIIGLAGLGALIAASVIHFGRANFLASMQALFGVLGALSIAAVAFQFRDTEVEKRTLFMLTIGLALLGLAAFLGAFSYL